MPGEVPRALAVHFLRNNDSGKRRKFRPGSAANRTTPVIGQFFERSARRDVTFTLRRIIFVSTYFTGILLHQQFLLIVLFFNDHGGYSVHIQ